MLCDSHTHLDEYPAGEVPEILDRASEAGVDLVVCAGVTVESSSACISLAETHRSFYAGVGIHPMNLEGPVDDAIYASLRDMAAEHEKVVCISEIGLDYQPTSPDHKTQEQAFRAQIRLAKELDLPIIFHSRESHPDALRILREEDTAGLGVIMHYFQADEETGREAIDSGFFISLARPLIRLPELQETVKNLPLESMVLESDSAPQPFKKHRYNWTEPRHVKDVADKLAEIKDVPVEEIARVTSSNLRRILRLG